MHPHICHKPADYNAACTGRKVPRRESTVVKGRRGVEPSPERIMQHTHAQPSASGWVAACAAKASRQFCIYLYFCRYSFDTYQYNNINMALSQALRCSVLRSAIPLACSPVCRRVSASAAPHFAAQSHCLRTSAFVPSLSAFRPKVHDAASLWSRHSFYACSIDNGQPL